MENFSLKTKNTNKLKDSDINVIFADCLKTKNIKLRAGKVLYKTYTSFDAPGVYFGIAGFMCLVGGIPKQGDLNITLIIAGVIFFIAGAIMKKLIASYSVFDYVQNKIYTEVFLGSMSIYKSKALLRSNILEVAVDHRKPEASLDNMGNSKAMNGSGRSAVSKTDSAVALLQRDGKIYYFNSFSNQISAHDFCNNFAKAISVAWNITYKNADLTKKLVVVKYMNSYSMTTEDVFKVTSGSIIQSMLRIIVGVVIAYICFRLFFWFLYLLLK